MIFSLVTLSSNNAFAQIPQLHNQTLYEVIKETSQSDEKSYIDVGDSPSAIAVTKYTPTSAVYVLNSSPQFSNGSVSVISAQNNTKIGEDITVGDFPTDIPIDRDTNTVYVVNERSDSVSVIDGTANEVVAGVTFKVNPINSGYIVCDDLTTPSADDLTPPSPIEQYNLCIFGFHMHS
jgi:YVTN family beta-propeller protein